MIVIGSLDDSRKRMRGFKTSYHKKKSEITSCDSVSDPEKIIKDARGK